MEEIKVKQNYLADRIIYSGIYVVFGIVMFLIEYFILGTENWKFLIIFRLISVGVDVVLWGVFEKLRYLMSWGLLLHSYFANVFAFMITIQFVYIIRLVAARSHFDNLGMYIVVVILSSFAIAPLIVWIKEYIKNNIKIIKFWIINKFNWIKRIFITTKKIKKVFKHKWCLNKAKYPSIMIAGIFLI